MGVTWFLCPYLGALTSLWSHGLYAWFWLVEKNFAALWLVRPISSLYYYFSVLGQSYIVHPSEFWMISWFNFALTNFTNTISSPRVSNLVLYPPRRASAFISRQPDLAGILVVLWIIIFLSKVKLCKTCLSKCNWWRCHVFLQQGKLSIETLVI